MKSDADSGRSKNLSFVLVATDRPGISYSNVAHSSIRYARTGDVIFDDVEVPASNIVGGSSNMQCNTIGGRLRLATE